MFIIVSPTRKKKGKGLGYMLPREQNTTLPEHIHVLNKLRINAIFLMIEFRLIIPIISLCDLWK